MCATVCCSNHIRFFQNLKTGLFKDFQESLDLGKDEVERSTTLFQELCFQHQHVQFNQNVASCVDNGVILRLALPPSRDNYRYPQTTTNTNATANTTTMTVLKLPVLLTLALLHVHSMHSHNHLQNRHIQYYCHNNF